MFQSVAIPAAASRFTGPFAMAEPKYVVRYGRMRTLGEFRSLPELDCARGDQVLIRTERGTELGEVLCPVSERTTLYMGSSPRGEILRRRRRKTASGRPASIRTGRAPSTPARS